MRPGVLHICVFALLLATLAGCRTRPDSMGHRDLLPLQNQWGQAQSLALSNPGVVAVHEIAPPNGYPAQPWYTGRNDLVPFVHAGFVGPASESSVTFTRDRQTISNGRVRDHYSETTFRRTFRDGQR